MKLGAKLGVSGGGLVGILVLIIFVVNISYQNTYERIQQDIEAQYKKIETDHEKMSRIILQQATSLGKLQILDKPPGFSYLALLTG